MKAFRNWTLRGRLAALLVATLVPLTGLTAFWIFWEVREERTRLQGEVQNMAELIASQAAQSVAGVYERLGILARSPAVRAGNRQEIERFFRNLLPHAPHLQNLGLVASDGMVLASAVPLPQGRPVSLKDREWFQRVVRWGEPAAGGFQIGRITGNPNVILAHPVLDEKEELTGVVFAALDLAHVSRTVTWAYPGVPLLWAIVDEQGMVLLHSRPETTSGKPLAPLPGMIRGETVVPGTRWHSIVGMPEEMASAQVRQAFLRMGLPAGLILLLGAMLSLWIARNTWRPLRALTVAVRQVGLGNSDVRTPVHAGGEVGELTTTFAETLAALDRRRLELASLLQASRAMVSSLDLEQSLQAIVRQAASISGAPAIRLFLLDEDTQVLRYRVGIGLPPEEERNRVVQVGESFSGQVAATGKPLVVSDTRGDSRLIYPEHVVRFGLVSYLGLPVKVGNRVIGVLIINTTAPRTYSEEEIAFLSVFADQAAIAIENARLYSATVRREAELEALLRATRSVMAGLDLHESLDRIVEEASRIAGTPHVKVLLRESETHALRVGAVAGHPGAMFAHRQYPPTASLSGIVAATGQPLFTPDSQNDSRNPHGGMDRELGLVTYLGLPIKSRGEVVGVLTFNTEAPHEYTPEEIAYLTSFADQAAIAIENARLHETTVRRAQQLATLNELTRKLTTVLEPQRVAEEILAAVQALIPEAAGRLWERVEETDRFRVVASLGLGIRRGAGTSSGRARA